MAHILIMFKIVYSLTPLFAYDILSKLCHKQVKRARRMRRV